MTEHKSVVTVYSSEDGGYYAECRDCWVAGPVCSTAKEALSRFHNPRTEDVCPVSDELCSAAKECRTLGTHCLINS